MNEILQWDRSEDKRCISKCSRYAIRPEYMGGSQVQCYNVYYYGEQGMRHGTSPIKLDVFGYTQKVAKSAAQTHANRIAVERDEEHKKFLEKEKLEGTARMKKFREDNFAVKVEPPRQPARDYDFDDMYLQVTHNGSQWSQVGLTNSEALQVVVDLLRFINTQTKV